MAEKTTKSEDFPGLSVERFKTTVVALSKLWDSGKFLFFLPRRNWLKIVGDNKELRDLLNEIAGEGEFDEEGTIEALKEVRLFWGALVRLSRVEVALRMIEQTEYDDFFDKVDDEAQSSYREILKEKLTALEKEQLSEVLKERTRRLKTTTGASLEELDVEVIRERRDEVEESTIESPFLRLRLRYSEERQISFPFVFYGAGPGQSAPVDSFELECDQSDIDFLIKRLIDAKKRLIPEAEEPIED